MKKTMDAQKRIALIAHDNKKRELVDWCVKHRDVLSRHFLCGTGTTARLVADAANLPVKAYKSGPLGGDQQVGAQIANSEIDVLIFFSDPLEAQPHDPDIKALVRISTVYDIPMANNRATADFLITSGFMSSPYEHEVIDSEGNADERAERMKER